MIQTKPYCMGLKGELSLYGWSRVRTARKLCNFKQISIIFLDFTASVDMRIMALHRNLTLKTENNRREPSIQCLSVVGIWDIAFQYLFQFLDFRFKMQGLDTQNVKYDTLGTSKLNTHSQISVCVF